MRCYFLIDGHIAGIEMMTGLSDRDAVTKARLLFSERRIPFDGYEVWDQTRFVFRHPNNPYVEKPKPIGRGRQPPLTMTEHAETRWARTGLGQPQDRVTEFSAPRKP
jgi:hypothetical protein